MKSVIKQLLRNKLLTEMEDKKYSYGCVMLYLDLDKAWWDKIQDNISDDDVYTEDGYGRETEPHITVLYGLHDDIPDSDIEAAVDKMTSPEITLRKISSFNNEKFDVIKFDVEGEGLFKMNKLFTKFPHTTDFPDYHPHTTIAYVKAGKGDEYHKTLDKDESLMLKPSKIVYSKADGTKKEYPFK